MSKPFFEVFPSLQVNPQMKKLLSEMKVERITESPDGTLLRIYLSGHHLVHRTNFFRLEEEIVNQLFPKTGLTVKIFERYELSKQYTPEALFSMYGESIEAELSHYSILLSNVYHSARMVFDRPDHLILTLPDTIVSRERGDELVDILEKIVCERCGLKLMIEPQLSPSESRRKSRDIALKRPRTDAETKTPQNETEPTEPADQKESEKQEEERKTKETKRTGRKKSLRRSDDPNVLYGRDIDGDTIPISEIMDGSGEVMIRGKILMTDSRDIRNDRTIVIVTMTDFTDTIVIKVFLHTEDEAPELIKALSPGTFIKVAGVTTIDTFDHELTIGSIRGIKKIPDFTSARMDHSPEKRVELHCHTKMSDMDGVSSVESIIKQAVSFGHKALAITDHGVVQAFPVANHAIPKGSDLKLIYGVEAYLVDDLKDIIHHAKDQSLEDTYVVFDLETTGFSPETNRIIEIGAVKVEDGKITDRFSEFVNPKAQATTAHRAAEKTAPTSTSATANGSVCRAVSATSSAGASTPRRMPSSAQAAPTCSVQSCSSPVTMQKPASSTAPWSPAPCASA